MDSSEKEPEIDLLQLTENYRETNRALKEVNASLLDMMGELTFSDDETKGAVEAFMQAFREG